MAGHEVGLARRRFATLDPAAKVLAYLDDVYVVVDGKHAEAAVKAAQPAVASIGLELNPRKNKTWTFRPQAPLPSTVEPCRVATLTFLGGAVPFLDRPDDEDPRTDTALDGVLQES